MINIGNTIAFLNDLYRDSSKYTDGMLLDNMLACYATRKAALLAGDMDVYERNTLELGVIRSIVLDKMERRGKHE